MRVNDDRDERFDLRKQMFFEQMNVAYKELRQDKKAWQSELEERSLFDKTTGDCMTIRALETARGASFDIASASCNGICTL